VHHALLWGPSPAPSTSSSLQHPTRISLLSGRSPGSEPTDPNSTHHSPTRLRTGSPATDRGSAWTAAAAESPPRLPLIAGPWSRPHLRRRARGRVNVFDVPTL
jgi:hypothetical protein